MCFFYYLKRGVFRLRKTTDRLGKFSPHTLYREGWSRRDRGLGWSHFMLVFGLIALQSSFQEICRRSGCRRIRKSPLSLVISGWKLLLGKVFAGSFFLEVFFLTINFLLASHFPLTSGNLVFIVLLGGLRAQGVHTPAFPPVDSYLNLDYDYMMNLLGKVISKGHMLEFQKSPSFPFHSHHKNHLPIQSDYYKVF